MRVLLDHEACQGHGRCYDLAPAVFGADDGGFAVLLFPGDVPPELEARARTAALNCPEDALTAVE